MFALIYVGSGGYGPGSGHTRVYVTEDPVFVAVRGHRVNLGFVTPEMVTHMVSSLPAEDRGAYSETTVDDESLVDLVRDFFKGTARLAIEGDVVTGSCVAVDSLCLVDSESLSLMDAISPEF